ncbi:MAG: DUF6339 family protein [Deltaproteobacteria bacterium]
MRLYSLEGEARRLVTPELVDGTVDGWAEDVWRPLVTDAPRGIELHELEAVVDESVSTFDPYDAGIDGWVGARLHRALPLTRREASDAGVWRFLAVVHRPAFVRHRWENRSWSTMWPRFWSIGMRHTSNTFARLWWIAELTRDGDDYTLTDRVLAKQGLAIPLFVRAWSWHRPAVVAAMDALEDAPSETVERVTRELSRYLATVPLEGRDEAALRAMLLRLR